jgi:anti-sigma-K factor RskA
MRRRRPELHTLAGAYALDAVTPADRARFERHLAACQACGLELAELREVTAALAGAAAKQPPASLLAEVIKSAARTPQLGPAAAGPGARRLRRWKRGPIPRPAVTLPAPATVRLALFTRVAVMLTAVLLAVTAGSSAVAMHAEHQLAATQNRDHQIAEVLNAPDAIMKTAHVHPAGTATVVLSRRMRALVLTTAGLPTLPAGQCYQLWLIGPAGERSAGMLPASRNGMTSPMVATGLAPGDWAGLTIEPEGGTQHPTTSPILMLSLAT